MKNRWIVLVAGVVIQAILGGIYAWSVFIPYLTEGYGLNRAQCGTVFGLSVLVFTLTMIVGGRVLGRHGPRVTAGIGAVLFIAGYTVACFSSGRFALLLLGISCLGGAGIGFGYVCPLSVGMRWFPRHKGLITGVAVAGFGGGAIALSSVASFFMARGMDVLDFFGWVALVAGVPLFLAAMLLAVPGDATTVREKAHEATDGVFTTPFLLCALGIFAGTFSGLLVIGNLTEIATVHGLTLRVAVQGVSAFAIGNALGRITWGYLFDRIHFRAIPASLATFAIGLALLAVTGRAIVFLPVAALLGFGFGANFVVYAAALTRHFGIDSFAKLYPLCFLGYGVAGITGPSFGGYLADTTGSYTPALVLSIVLLAMATTVTWLGLRTFTRTERTPAPDADGRC